MKKLLSSLIMMLGLWGVAHADYQPPTSAEYPPQTLGAEPPVHDNPESLQTKPGNLGHGGSMEIQDPTDQNQNPNMDAGGMNNQ